MSKFDYDMAEFLPFQNKAECERVRAIKREPCLLSFRKENRFDGSMPTTGQEAQKSLTRVFPETVDKTGNDLRKHLPVPRLRQADGGEFNYMRHLRKKDLENKIIDAHSHTGVALGSYGRAEYPYAQTVEGLYYRQIQGGVDINIVFPFTADLYVNLPRLT